MESIEKENKKNADTVQKATTKRSRVKITEVARQLGVAVSTVSNAYNRPDQLSPALRQQILATAQQMGYPGPDPAARRLRRGQAGVISVLYTDSLTYAFADPVAVEFLRGVASAVEAAGLGLLLLPSASLENRNPDVVANAVVDGFIIYSMGEDDPLTNAALARRLPTVMVDQLQHPELPFVGIDDEKGARLAAEHLLELGHRRFGIISMRFNQQVHNGLANLARQQQVTHQVTRSRLRGYKSALVAAGLDWENIPVYEGFNNGQVAGRQAAEILLNLQPRPTAILALSDEMALGIVEVAQQLGLRIPDELSVVGFDNIPAANYVNPPLTTVAQPIFEKGLLAGQLLIEQLTQTELDEKQAPHRILPSSLIIRGSSGVVHIIK